MAHCLEFDIAGTSKESFEDACDELNELIQVHIEYAYENDNPEYLYKPAPAKYRNKVPSVRVLRSEQSENHRSQTQKFQAAVIHLSALAGCRVNASETKSAQDTDLAAKARETGCAGHTRQGRGKSCNAFETGKTQARKKVSSVP